MYPFRPWEKTVATKLRSGPCSAKRLAVRPPPPPALPTGGRQGVDPPRSVHGDKTNKQGGTDLFWDSAETATDDRGRIFLDRDGEQVAEADVELVTPGARNER